MSVQIRERMLLRVRPWMVQEGDMLGNGYICDGVTERRGSKAWNIWYTNVEGNVRMLIRLAHDLVEVFR